jgi:hypothetical protein
MTLRWEEIMSRGLGFATTFRANVPAGWFVFIKDSPGQYAYSGLTFYPDPEHKWDGNSLP